MSLSTECAAALLSLRYPSVNYLLDTLVLNINHRSNIVIPLDTSLNCCYQLGQAKAGMIFIVKIISLKGIFIFIQSNSNGLDLPILCPLHQI